MLIALALLQAAAQTPPDIQLDASVSVRRVRIERQGEARLEVQGGEGSVVSVEAPETGGRTRLRNVNVRIRAEARIADPLENRPEPETPEPE